VEPDSPSRLLQAPAAACGARTHTPPACHLAKLRPGVYPMLLTCAKPAASGGRLIRQAIGLRHHRMCSYYAPKSLAHRLTLTLDLTLQWRTCTPSGCTTRTGGGRIGFCGPSDGDTLLSATSGPSVSITVDHTLATYSAWTGMLPWQPCLQHMRPSLGCRLPSVASEGSDGLYHSHAHGSHTLVLIGSFVGGRYAGGSPQEEQRLPEASCRLYRERCCRVMYTHLARRRPWRAALAADAA